MRKSADIDGATDSSSIQLVSTPPASTSVLRSLTLPAHQAPQDDFSSAYPSSRKQTKTDDNDPFTLKIIRLPSNLTNQRSPQTNSNLLNPQASAGGGGGGGVGGKCTPNAGMGGGGPTGGGGQPVGGSLATLAMQGAFGPLGGVQGGGTTPLSPPTNNAPHVPVSANTSDFAANTNGHTAGPLVLSGGAHQLSGVDPTFNAWEGGLANGVATEPAAFSPLVQGTAGAALTNVAVATFSDPDPNSTASDFTATINWGDNSTPTTGTITASASGGFSIAGSHTYTASGTYSVQATITDVVSGQSTMASTQAVVNDAALTATAATINATEGSAANNVTVATFTDANPFASASSFTAGIDWGDGNTSTGVVTGANGNFTVTGSHTYTEGGSYQVSVTVQSMMMGSSAAVASTATVTDLPLTATQLSVTPALTGASTTLTDTFTDANTSEVPGNYMAQINWGDGWTDDATVSGANGSYSLTGSHVYDHPGNYAVSVTVTDAGGATLTQTANTTISAAALSASGTTLTATAGQALSNAQIATFTDANTDQMNDYYGAASGYTATVDWGDGTGLDTSPTVMGDANGFYVIGNHTYANPGAYTATVTITNADGASATATSTTDVTTMTPTGATFNASEGVAANNVTVATFTDTQSDTYTTSIDWGDGSTPTSGVVSGSGGSYSVSGNHTYADGGAYPVTVTITNSAGLNAIAVGTANVADAPLTATPQTVTAYENTALNNATLATFTDANTNDPLASYSASIDWGDGSPTDVGTIAYANGVYTVTGSHTYTSEGTFTATVYIGDAGGATTTASSTVNVTAPVINATAETLSAQEGVALNNATVATFTAPGQASDYMATIDWGDGGTSTGTVTGSNGNFSVLGSYSYAEQTGGQQFLVTVTITDMTGDTATALSSATVDGGTLAASGTTVPATEGTAGNFALANFTDTNASYAADEYTATVDWGDGNQDVATVTGSNGVFSVVDAHTYAEDGSYTATVTITDPNGISTQTVSDLVSVADAALTPMSSGASLEVTQGVAANGLAVAQFSDGNLSEVPAAFTASINWGDGTAATAGVVSGAGGLFSVSGSHTYAAAGSYTASVTVTDAGGSQVVLTTPVTVDATPVYTVANFTDQNTSDPASAFTATINWGDNTPTSYGTVSGGNGNFTVTGSHSYAEEQTYPVSVTITGPGGPIVVQSSAQVGDPPTLGSQPPQAPPAKLEAPAAVSKITFDLTPPIPFVPGLYNMKGANAPGVRIHIDDSFYVKVLDPADPTKNTMLADYQQNSIDPAKDQNLIHGTITIGPANSQGLLSWSIPNGLRVWWQPVPGGPWSQVDPLQNPANFRFKATGQPIPIAVQGVAIGSGELTATYTINGQKLPTTASFFESVYTGLNVSGQAPPQQAFLTQLAAASGYTFAVNANGDVWRKTNVVVMPKGTPYVATVQPYIVGILINSAYGNYAVETAETTVTAVTAFQNTPGIMDSFPARTVYPDNIATVIKAPGWIGADGSKYGAAAIIHALMEQYEWQIYKMPFQTNPAKNLKQDTDAGGAFASGVSAEQAILGWGTRLTTEKDDKPNNDKIFTFTYTDAAGKTTTVVMKYDSTTTKLESVTPKRPGQ
jgi:hypothetical protein